MTSQNTQNDASWDVPYGFGPRKGSRTLPKTIDFSLSNPANINLVDEQKRFKLESVQALYIDNSLNPNSLTAVMQNTGQTVTIPGGYQAYLPVLSTTDNPVIQFSTSLTPKVSVSFLNFPVPACIWAANGGTGGSTGTDFSANQPALLGHLIATMPVNAARNNIECQNQSALTIQLVLDDGTGANGQSIILLAPNTGGAGLMGADFSDRTFFGRARVFATNTTDQVMLRQT